MPTVQSDPFQPVLDALGTLASDVAPVSSKIHGAASLIDPVQQAVNRIKTFQSNLNNAVSDMGSVRDLCEGLTEIPVVGEFADTAASAIGDVTATIDPVVNTINDTIGKAVDPVQDVLAKLQTGLDKLDKGLSDVVNGVPVATNTIVILQSLSSIVTNLALGLEGSTVGDRLKALLDDFATVRQKIEDALKVLTPCIQDIASAADTVHQVLAAAEELGSEMATAIEAVGSVSSILDPISSAMNAVEDAIAPVRWALDAVSCVFNEIVQPVIDALMDSLGLGALVNSLANELTTALHISDIATEIESKLGGNVLQNSEASFAQLAGRFTQSWNEMQGLLAQYTGDAGGPQEAAMQQLVNAISGAPAGSGPVPLAPWPDPGPAYTPPAPKIGPTIHAPAFARIQASLTSLATPTATMSAPESRIPDAHEVLQRSDSSLPPLGSSWAQITTLDSDIDAAVKGLSVLQTGLTNLSARAAAFNSSLGFGDVLGRQLDDVAVGLQLANDTLDVLQKLPVIGSDMPPILAAVQNQISACANSQKLVTQMGQGIQSLSTAVQRALTQAPRTSLVAQAIGQMNGWKSGAEMLARSIDRGRAAKQTPASPVELNQRAGQLIARAQDLQKTVQNIRDSENGVGAAVDTLIQQLQAYANSLLTISAHGVTVSSEGQNNIDEIAHLLSVIDSLIKPLALLMGQLGCVAPEAKQHANQALQGFISVATEGATNSTNRVTTLLNQVLAKSLPIEDITREAQQACATLAQATRLVTTASNALGDHLAALGQNLEATLSYTVQSKSGQTLVIKNVFLDAETAGAVVELDKSLNA